MVTACARKRDCSFEISFEMRRFLARSSAETMDSLAVFTSQISPLEDERMLMVSLSTDERSSSSES
jgi:hypothetical protein